MQASTELSRQAAIARDLSDPLRALRERFSLPPDVIYLDGNSLGALPIATLARLDTTVRTQWGGDLISSWSTHDWLTLPQRVGAKIAALLGAAADEVVVADSTSINIFKLLSGALTLPHTRDDAARAVLLCERNTFPTDSYIAAGLCAMQGGRITLRYVEADHMPDAFDETVAVALLSHVDYRSGALRDMRALNRAAAHAGTRIVWDLSHSAGALPIALNDTGAELAVGCGYKYFNGGPGAPAYAYVARHLHADFVSPLPGWFGHAAPFDFSAEYTPARGAERLLCGTPSIIAAIALDEGLNTFAGVDMAAVRAKSLSLGEFFLALMHTECADFGFTCVTPAQRGSHLTFSHTHAHAIMQALVKRGVVGDFRPPDLLRFGLTPLYTRYVDVWDAVALLRDVMQRATWKTDAAQ